MPGVKFILPDKTPITLIYNGIAVLRMEECGADRRIMGEDSENGDNNLFEIASALAEGGEMYNRYMGSLPQIIPNTEVFSKLDKLQKIRLRIAVLQTIIECSGVQEESENNEEDLGLAELAETNRKNKTEIMTDLLSVGALTGINTKEALLLPIGVLNKLAEHNTKLRGLSKWGMM